MRLKIHSPRLETSAGSSTAPQTALRGAFAALFLTAWTTCAPAAVTTTNLPTSDAFVRAEDPTRNYGGAGALAVSGTASTNRLGVANGVFDTLMRFSLGDTVSNFNSVFGAGNWTLTAATLFLTENAAPNNDVYNRGVGAFRINWMTNDTWIEGSGNPSAPTGDGAVWDDLVALVPPGSTVPLGNYTNAGANTRQAFALSLSDPGFLTDLMSGSDVGLFFDPIDSGLGFTFNSRSFGTVSARPMLTLTAVPEPGVDTMLALGGAAAAAFGFRRAKRNHERV